MNAKYVASIDQGTTGTRAVLYDREGRMVSSAAVAHRQYYPEPGWVSHDAEEIYQNAVGCLNGAIEKAKAKAGDVAAIGITNQRETVVAWDRKTGAPVCKALVWQCRRTAEICARAEADGMAGAVRKKTGLVIDPYFSATKFKWILDNVPEAGVLMAKGELLAGTVDSYMIWKLTGGRAFVTDYSNASRTMLFDIGALAWDSELLDYFGVPEDMLPRVVPTSGYIGEADIWGIPVAAAAGDQQAALFGQLCFNPGDIKNTYGTGCFILKNIGEKPVISGNGLLTTIAWHIDGRTEYALEGSVFNAGSAVEWLIHGAKLVKDVEEINAICDQTPDTGGVYFVPAFSGLGAPNWDTDARAIICGMSLAADKNAIVRALMESIAYQSRDVIGCMERETGVGVGRIRADGGVCRSDFLMRFQANIMNATVGRPHNIETTSLGAAYLAGLAIKFWDGADEIGTVLNPYTEFAPSMSETERHEKYAGWMKAVERARN